MEFQLTEDFVKDNGFTEEQIKAITNHVTGDYVPTLQKQWDGKANENAEGIINGAIKSVQKQFGVELARNDGEKNADYLARLNEFIVSEEKQKVTNLKSDYEQKLKDFKGGDATKAELEKVKNDYNKALEKLANYDELEEKASKYEEASQTLSTLKLEVAFNGVKPSFPQETNKYEAKAKWDEFKRDVLDKYTIELVDGVPMAIDKENHFKNVKLEELVGKNETIQGLLEGRQQQGT